MRSLLRASLAVLILAGSAIPAAAQTGGDDLRVSVYPLFGWVPIYGANVVSVPDLPDIPGGGGGSGSGSGEEVSGGSIDTSLNGALLFGFGVAKGPWRVESDGLWAALRGERPDRPILDVDLDLIYGHAVGSYRVYKDFFVSGGVRRIAANYKISLEGLSATFSNKPGFWDPLIGVGYHRIGDTLELHGTFDANVFDTGAKSDLAGSFRADWKPIPHFGLVFGYAIIHLELEKRVLEQKFSIEQTLHGPIVGIGLYF